MGTKISALTAATAGAAADVVPIVQGGTTKKLPIKDLFLAGGQIAFPATQNASADANTLDDYEEGTYAVSWASSGTQPAIGNGTLTGTYTKIGRQVTVTIRMVCGGTTTFGTGTYSWSLPFTAMAAYFLGNVFSIDGGSVIYGGPAYIESGGTVVRPYEAGVGQYAATVPFTWANTDELIVTVTYFV